MDNKSPIGPYDNFDQTGWSLKQQTQYNPKLKKYFSNQKSTIQDQNPRYLGKKLSEFLGEKSVLKLDPKFLNNKSSVDNNEGRVVSRYKKCFLLEKNQTEIPQINQNLSQQFLRKTSKSQWDIQDSSRNQYMTQPTAHSPGFKGKNYSPLDKLKNNFKSQMEEMRVSIITSYEKQLKKKDQKIQQLENINKLLTDKRESDQGLIDLQIISASNFSKIQLMQVKQQEILVKDLKKKVKQYENFISQNIADGSQWIRNIYSTDSNANEQEERFKHYIHVGLDSLQKGSQISRTERNSPVQMTPIRSVYSNHSPPAEKISPRLQSIKVNPLNSKYGQKLLKRPLVYSHSEVEMWQRYKEEQEL